MARTLSLILVLVAIREGQAQEKAVTLREEPNQLHIAVGGKPFATYVYKNDQVLRPFFAHVHTLSGKQVTRSFPPVPGKDAVDHATMHPGIWLGFGDLSGQDFWRNKGTVKHVKFLFQAKGNTGTFAVQNRYEANAKGICEEESRMTIQAYPKGILLHINSQLKNLEGISFGDQEEMGLGLRVATPLAVKQGGQIINSDGLKNEKQVWGKQADWCAYQGTIDGQQAGMLLMPHPENLRRSRFHARDYGLLVANPFGQRVFTKGAGSIVNTLPGSTFLLRFGIFVYDGAVDHAAIYKEYIAFSQKR